MGYILSPHFEQILFDVSSSVGRISSSRAVEEISLRSEKYGRLHKWALTHDGLSLKEWSFLTLELIEYIGMSGDDLNKLSRRAPSKKGQIHALEEKCAVNDCYYEKNSSSGRRGKELAKLEIDHIWPWSLGGPTVSWNLQFLCHAHNKMKSNSIPIDKFLQPEFLSYVQAHLRNEAYKRGVVL